MDFHRELSAGILPKQQVIGQLLNPKDVFQSCIRQVQDFGVDRNLLTAHHIRSPLPELLKSFDSCIAKGQE